MSLHWKSLISGLTAGLVLLGGAWAGVSLGPVPLGIDPADAPRAAMELAPVVSEGAALEPSATYLAGANATSIVPRADKWQRTGCFALEDGNLDADHALPSGGDSWPAATPDCVYLGGYGIGPARPAESADPEGVWVRSIAVSNGTRTFVFQVIDAVGYFYRYQNGVCTDCGIFDMRNAIAAANSSIGLTASDVLIASTHTHAGPDFYGGWGGVPTWYAEQVRDAVVSSANAAIAALAPATLEAGEVYLRRFNNERRDTYYSNVDEQAVWLQARRVSDGTAIATLANYAGHPTIVDDRQLHADWPGAAARRFEALYGGVGLLFEGGLGNVSVSGVGGATNDENAENTGRAFANAVAADIDVDPASTAITDLSMAASVRTFAHPVLTNQGLAKLGMLGFFTREFIPGTPGADGPGAYHWSKRRNPEHPEYLRGCDAVSEVQIRTTAGAYKIGQLSLYFGPGELFSNITETVKSKRRGSAVTAVLGQGNDALGYILQSFEYDVQGGAVTEYGTQTGEYEEVFAIDRCFGDHVLQEMLDAGAAIGA